MITSENLIQYLEDLAGQHPNKIIAKLTKGSKVQKSSGLSYEIDDPEIDRRLGDFPEGTLPYGPIHRALRDSPSGIWSLFNGQFEAPFSRAYESGFGECLEKAILVQLAAQRSGPSFLIKGSLAVNGQYVESHGYNLIFKNKIPLLVDVQNPLAKNKNGEITNPYIAPILGIDGINGDFIVPPEWKQERTYSIF